MAARKLIKPSLNILLLEKSQFPSSFVWIPKVVRINTNECYSCFVFLAQKSRIENTSHTHWHTSVVNLPHQ